MVKMRRKGKFKIYKTKTGKTRKRKIGVRNYKDSTVPKRNRSRRVKGYYNKPDADRSANYKRKSKPLNIFKL